MYPICSADAAKIEELHRSALPFTHTFSCRKKSAKSLYDELMRTLAEESGRMRQRGLSSPTFILTSAEISFLLERFSGLSHPKSQTGISFVGRLNHWDLFINCVLPVNTILLGSQDDRRVSTACGLIEADYLTITNLGMRPEKKKASQLVLR